MHARKEKVTSGFKKKQQAIVVPTYTIVNTCTVVMVVKDVHNIHRSVWNRNQIWQYLQRHPICLTDSDHALYYLWNCT